MRNNWTRFALSLTLIACGASKFSSTAPVVPKKAEPVVPEVSTANEANQPVVVATSADQIPTTDGSVTGVFGQRDDKVSQGAVGNIYNLISIKDSLWDGRTTGFFKALPDFASLTPVGSILAKQFDLPKTSFLEGFPGIDASLKEYFGIGFSGRLVVPASGEYEFSLSADDGAIFSIDNKVIVDADGVHKYLEKRSIASLTAGTFPFALNYMQMPRTEVGLTLKWKVPGSSAFVIVPASAILRP